MVDECLLVSHSVDALKAAVAALDSGESLATDAGLNAARARLPKECGVLVGVDAVRLTESSARVGDVGWAAAAAVLLGDRVSLRAVLCWRAAADARD